MNKALLTAIMHVVQAKINYALEADHGRDTTHEILTLNEWEKKLEAFFDAETGVLLATPAPEPAPSIYGSPSGISELFLREMPAGWWMHKLAEERLPITHRGDTHTRWKDPNRQWICELQHEKGGLLTTAYGATMYGAFRACCTVVRENHGG